MANFRNQKGIVSLDRAVRRAEGRPPGRAVGCQQTVERIPRPREADGVANQGQQRDFVHNEPRIIQKRVREPGVLNLQPSDFLKKLDF
jgi:hypothetical protein